MATVLVCLLGCAGGDDYIVIGSSRVPSTAGLLTVDTDDASSEIELSMEFLPPPQTLSPRLTRYVAWILPPQGSAIRLGALHYVARDRMGTLTAECIAAPYAVQITAEPNAPPRQPSTYVVAEAAVSAN